MVVQNGGEGPWVGCLVFFLDYFPKFWGGGDDKENSAVNNQPKGEPHNEIIRMA